MASNSETQTQYKKNQQLVQSQISLITKVLIKEKRASPIHIRENVFQAILDAAIEDQKVDDILEAKYLSESLIFDGKIGKANERVRENRLKPLLEDLEKYHTEIASSLLSSGYDKQITINKTQQEAESDKPLKGNQRPNHWYLSLEPIGQKVDSSYKPIISEPEISTDNDRTEINSWINRTGDNGLLYLFVATTIYALPFVLLMLADFQGSTLLGSILLTLVIADTLYFRYLLSFLVAAKKGYALARGLVKGIGNHNIVIERRYVETDSWFYKLFNAQKMQFRLYHYAAVCSQCDGPSSLSLEYDSPFFFKNLKYRCKELESDHVAEFKRHN